MPDDEKVYLALGLMSGTSRDGIDAALIRTDGHTFIEPGPALSRPYDPAFRARLAAGVQLAAIEGRAAAVALTRLEADLTAQHAFCVDTLLKKADLTPGDVDVIGFHGHSMLHSPVQAFSWQMGDGAALARQTGIDVVADFRRQDIEAGGEGAPLAPVYHRACLYAKDAGTKSAHARAILNIGGVSNVTYVAPDHDTLLAFDCGPGNALIDDWVFEKTGRPFDENGRLARQGTIHHDLVEQFMLDSYFAQKPPKSLDRDRFDTRSLRSLSVEDGAATLTACTIAAIGAAEQHFPAPVAHWYVAGGGRHNHMIMDGLQRTLSGQVASIDVLGFRGDYIEAEAFGYLAVRSLKALPISWPGTTGVAEPLTGGTLFRA